MTHEPTQRIDSKAIHVWWISGGFGSLFYWLIPIIYPLFNFDFPYHNWVWYGLWGLVIINTILQFTVIPYVRWKKWRYSIDEKEIQLKRGLIVTVNTLVPVKRIQHVDTRQGPLENIFDMSSVSISTAATTHIIPLLNENTAEDLRDRISKYARLSNDEDV